MIKKPRQSETHPIAFRRLVGLFCVVVALAPVRAICLAPAAIQTVELDQEELVLEKLATTRQEEKRSTDRAGKFESPPTRLQSLTPASQVMSASSEHDGRNGLGGWLRL